MRLDPTCEIVEFRGTCLLSVVQEGQRRAWAVNESFAFLVRRFRDIEFEEDDVVMALQEEYGIQAGQAGEGACEVIRIWKELGLILN